MTSLARKTLGAFAGAALIATPMAAIAQDMAQPANANASAQTQTVQYVGAENETLGGARLLAASASRNKIAIVVWGGTQQFQQEAYNAALDINDMGIPVAFVRAPDHNENDGGAVYEIFGESLPQREGALGFDNINLVRSDIRNAALRVQSELYPQQVAVLQPTAGN